MSAARPRGPIVIDTDVFSADLVPGSKLAELYAPIITGRPAFISFQTVTELRYGALRREWGSARMLKLDAKIQRAEVIHTARSSCSSVPSFAPTAPQWVTLSPSASTTPTAGSPQPQFVSACRWCPMTHSSAACPDSRSRLPANGMADSQPGTWSERDAGAAVHGGA